MGEKRPEWRGHYHRTSNPDLATAWIYPPLASLPRKFVKVWINLQKEMGYSLSKIWASIQEVVW